MMEYRLSDIFDLQMGKTPDRNNTDYWTNGLNQWISIADISKCDKYIINTAECISDIAVTESNIKIIPANVVIMSFKLSIGKIAITSKPMYSNEAIMAFLDKGIVKIEPLYLYYLLLHKDWNEATNKAVMGRTLNKATLSDIRVTIHNHNKQLEIINVLDKVNVIINAHKQQLSTLDTLIKARFVEMFGSVHSSILYPYVAIKELTKVTSGGTPSRDHPEYWNNGNINWIKTTELKNCVITKSEEKITVLGMENSSAKIVPPETILLAMYGQGKTRGMTAYLQAESTTNQACACILPSPMINSKYLWYYIILSYDKLRELAKGGNQPNLNGNIIKEFSVLLPPDFLQTDFVKFAEQVDKSKVIVQKALDEAQLLFDSLMQKYFG